MTRPTNRTNNATLIALDWGTTNVRAALFDKTGHVIEERQNKSGVGQFSQQQFAEHFERICDGWPAVPVLLAGMIGSRQGWQEAPYLACPIAYQKIAASLFQFQQDGRTITLVPGLKRHQENRFDVMRGEETQLIGLIEKEPNFNGTVIMPGTHSKWVTVKEGMILNFQTYMTGDLFNALSQHTLLSHSMATADQKHENNLEPSKAFNAQLTALIDTPRSIEGALFELRARSLLTADDSPKNDALSALLIMAELRAGQADGYDLGHHIRLIGAHPLTALYKAALMALNKTSTHYEGTSLCWPALFLLARQAKLID